MRISCQEPHRGSFLKLLGFWIVWRSVVGPERTGLLRGGNFCRAVQGLDDQDFSPSATLVISSTVLKTVAFEL